MTEEQLIKKLGSILDKTEQRIRNSTYLGLIRELVDKVENLELVIEAKDIHLDKMLEIIYNHNGGE